MRRLVCNPPEKSLPPSKLTRLPHTATLYRAAGVTSGVRSASRVLLLRAPPALTSRLFSIAEIDRARAQARDAAHKPGEKKEGSVQVRLGLVATRIRFSGCGFRLWLL